jgi:hypothetical protein
MYADDTAIIARSKQPRAATGYLQEAVNALEDWFRLWRIDVNPEKSSALLITRRRVVPVGQIQMFGRDIPWKDQVKYLGVILDKRLTFIPHIKHVEAQTKMVASRLSSLTCRKSKMSIRNKLVLYKSIIRPVMTYASVVWGSRLRLAAQQTAGNPESLPPISIQLSLVRPEQSTPSGGKPADVERISPRDRPESV